MRILFLLIIFLSSCSNNENTYIPPDPCPFWKSEIELDKAIEFQISDNAAFGYTSKRPLSFQEDTNIEFGNHIFYSKDKAAKVNFFIEEGVRRDLSNINEAIIEKENQIFQTFYKSILNGEYKLSQDLKFIKSEICLDKLGTPRNSRMYFLAQQLNKEIIWAIELSQIPISGDLIYKHLYFEYPIAEKNLYFPMGIEMINGFGWR